VSCPLDEGNVGESGGNRTRPVLIKSQGPLLFGIALKFGTESENRTPLFLFVREVSATSGVTRHGPSPWCRSKIQALIWRDRL
jgi:hypothetical protein